MRRNWCILSVLLAIVGPASAQHVGDVILTVVDGRIATNAAVGAGIIVPERVFTAAFGDSGCDAFTANPGFEAEPGTFAPSSSIGWNALAGVAAPDGAAFVDAGDAFLAVSFGSTVVEVHDAPVPGFSFFVLADGSIHRHVDFCMNGCPLGCGPPPEASSGVYLLELEMTSTDAGVAPSDPFWVVFDYDAAPGELDVALAHVADMTSVPPCPSDLDGDGASGFGDLLAVLTTWGACVGCDADLDGDDVVGFNDVLALLAAWGPCPR